jgi:V8-like Glu-specific endopeptidase
MTASRSSVPFVVIVAATCVAIAPVSGQVTTQRGNVLVIDATKEALVSDDYEKSIPKPLPKNQRYSREALKKDLVDAVSEDAVRDTNLYFRPGAPGDSQPLSQPPTLRAKRIKAAKGGEANGTANLPYSTARADLDPGQTNAHWPYRAAGKLFFKEAGKNYECTASLIGPGLVVTAAHCVADNQKNLMFSDWVFVPGYHKGTAPFGKWDAAKAYVLAEYPQGKFCEPDMAVCRDDVAILVLKSKLDSANKPYFPGKHTGWLAFVSGPQPFTKSGLAHVTQLGYPGCLDDGELMQRNDAQALISKGNRNNTIYGSLMCGGSSGGPVVSNFGIKPELTDTINGAASEPNVVIGVTSWGYEDDKKIKQQGASPFLASNIDFLIAEACKEYPAACAP